MAAREPASSRILYHKLIFEIETVRNDPRLRSCADNANVRRRHHGGSISHLSGSGQRQGRMLTHACRLAASPPKSFDSVVSVDVPHGFDFAFCGARRVSPMRFVCEEAHRYASADRSIGFGPKRRAFRLEHAQGRPRQVRSISRPRHPASRRLDATIIYQCHYHVCDAACQRTRPRHCSSSASIRASSGEPACRSVPRSVHAAKSLRSAKAWRSDLGCCASSEVHVASSAAQRSHDCKGFAVADGTPRDMHFVEHWARAMAAELLSNRRSQTIRLNDRPAPTHRWKAPMCSHR